MRRRPARPARSRRTQHTVAALVPALIIVLSITGFVWAQKRVTLVVDGRSTTVVTQAREVEAVLAEAGVAVGARDIIAPAQNARVTDGMSVTVRHAVPVTVRLGDDAVRVSVIGRTVADALVAAGTDPSMHPAVNPPLGARLSSGMVITAPDSFVRVERRRVPLPARTIVREVATRPAGERAVVEKGRPGVALRVWRSVVVGGVQGARTLEAEHVVAQSRPRVIEVGVARTIPQLIAVSHRKTNAGERPAHGRRMRVVATGYTAGEPGVNHTTATGDRVGRGVIAVDPDVIPLGSWLYVPGYGYGVAADTGGAIDGGRVDLYFDTYAETDAWGRRPVTIIVLD